MALVMALMLAMTACGGNKDAALEEYFQTDEMQEIIQDAKDSVEGTGMSIDLLALTNPAPLLSLIHVFPTMELFTVEIWLFDAPITTIAFVLVELERRV